MVETAQRPKPLEEIEETPFIDIYNPQKENPKRKPPTWKENLSSYFSEYCGATSVHGVQYVGERGRYLFERLIWTGILTVVSYFCILLILKTYNKWVTSPVIVTIATTETHISEIPFPAVTICPEVKSDIKMFNYTDTMIKKVLQLQLDDETKRLYESFSLVCDDLDELLAESGIIEPGRLTVDEDAIIDLYEAMPNISDAVIPSLMWLKRKYKMNELLTPSITSSGICYSFNMLDYADILTDTDEYVDNITSANQQTTKQWSLENGYPEDESIDTFPRRTFLSGMNGGFTFSIMTNQSEIDHLCSMLQGYMVTLHHPSELPNMDRHFRLPLDQAVMVAIKPRMITVSPQLLSYTPEARKCYMSHERSLLYYKSYTQGNCLDECLANYTLKQCGCISFYQPKDDDSPICGPGNKLCAETSKVNYLISDNSTCNCLPLCTSVEYDVEISQTKWKWQGMFNVINNILGEFSDVKVEHEGLHVSMLAVYYKEMQFLGTERNELYGSTDFFSNIGGLLGLFMGFSVTSAIEIIYFLTLRLVCNILKNGKAVWSGNDELKKRLN